MTSATGKVYCFTCKRWIPHVWWDRHMASLRHRNCILGIPPPPYSWRTGQPADAPAEADALEEDDGDDAEADALEEDDTRTQCGGCSRRITPKSEYWRDDGRAYHNGCVPLATTRPLNPAQATHAALQQAGKRVAVVGAGRPQNG